MNRDSDRVLRSSELGPLAIYPVAIPTRRDSDLMVQLSEKYCGDQSCNISFLEKIPDCDDGIVIAVLSAFRSGRQRPISVPLPFSKSKGDSMKHISGLLAVLLLLAPLSPIVGDTPNPQTPVDKIKRDIARLGVGSKATATIKLNNGTKVKGYVYSAGDDDFVMKNRKTDTPTTIRYTDVKSVDDNRGHSTARNVLIIVGIGAAITIAAVFGAILSNER